jgi:demethylspheroidene O-methyltransferase
VASPRFQSWAARFPLTRGVVRRDGEALMELVTGFVHSQILAACVDLGVLEALAAGPRSAPALAAECGLAPDRAAVLLDGAAAIGLVARRRDKVRLTRRGAALLGAPGVLEMIRHHRLLYADLADPAAFFRGETETRISRFWPYVLGRVGSEEAARYSALMADSQTLVAEETLAATRLRGVRHLMDVGGGTGAFLAAAARRYPRLELTLVDLPPVAEAARERLDREGLARRIDVVAADFRTELPTGADAISLVRVLYDHGDDTVAALLARVRRALPPGGRVIVSEPMLGTRAADTYFATYTMAMGTGRTRSPEAICALLRAANFVDARPVRTRRPFVTSVVEARAAEAVLSD